MLKHVATGVVVVAVSGLAMGQTADEAAAKAQAARERIAALEAEMAAAKADLEAAEADLAKTSGVAAPTGAEAPVHTPSWLEGWDGSVEVGLAGSDGNAEQLSFRTGVAATRKTERFETKFGLHYLYAKSDGTESANRFDLSLRNDWLFKESRWRLFAEGVYENDQFQQWDHRLSGFVGFGYEFINREKTTLIGRAGIGGSQEIGGPDEGFTPEALLGADFSHQLTERQKITASTDLFPSLDDGGEFRWINAAAWEINVDPETNMFLRLGALHRHESDPGAGFKNNDIDYFMTLGWSF